MDTLKFDSRVIHAGQSPEATSGAVMPPIFQTSTYAQEAPGIHKGHEYARVTNPTRSALEALLAGLENATDCAAFASGCAAMDAMFKILRPGDEVISSNDLYGGTYRLMTQVFEPFGIRFHFVDMADPDAIRAAITANTRMIWVETPTNPLLHIVDLDAVVGIAAMAPRTIVTVVDNTFASPYLQRPLDRGITAVVHSTTKYLGGHSDVIGGAICSSDADVIANMRFQVKATGAVPGPMDCYLTLRGIKTLSVRMDRACSNAETIARYLRAHPKVGRVRWPGFKDHPGHDIAARQMSRFGAMVSFTLKNDATDEAYRVMRQTRVFTLAESLGGVESLISHPSTMTHASIPADIRRATGLNDSLIRLSVGIEDAEDLIADLERAIG